MRHLRTRTALLSGAILHLGWVQPGHAQVTAADGATATSNPAAAQDDAVAKTSDDIVVTARKRSENQRDVPISLVTLSGGQLAAAKITQVSDLVARVPELTISYGVSNPFAQIRGLGTGNNISFDQAVGKFIDNVSYVRDQDLRLPLFDLDRVEVLKGPQVLLYGNSSTAGALNITTKKPGSEFEGDVSAAYEFLGQETVVQGGLTLPISPAISLRVSGLFGQLDKGNVYNRLTDEHVPTLRNYAVRGILKVQPSADIEVLLKAEYDRLRSRGNGLEVVAPPVSGPSPFLETNLDGVTATNNNVAPFFQKPFDELSNETYQADVNYDALGGVITSTSAYRHSRYAGSVAAEYPFPLAQATEAYDYRQASEELRFAGRFGAFDLTVGGYYQYEKMDVIEPIDFNVAAIGIPAPPFAANFALLQRTNSYSGFADATYRLSSSFSVEIGARYTVVTRDADQSVLTGNVVPNKRFGLGLNLTDPSPALAPLFAGFFGALPHNFTDLHSTDRFLQPQVIVQYRPYEDGQIFAKFVKGDKAGGFDANYPGTPAGTIPEQARFRPERAESYELGFKGLALNRRADIALTFFNTTFSDLQTNAFVSNGTVSIVTNVGKARSRGVEASLGLRLAPGLRLNATGTYADAKYIRFPGGDCTRAQLGTTPVGCSQDLSGRPTSFSSKFSGTVGLDYERPVGALVLTGGVAAIGRTKYNPSTNLDPLLDQHGYVQLDAHLDLKRAAGGWSASLFGRNLTDVNYLLIGHNVPASAGALGAIRARGRQVGVQLGYRF